MILAGILSTIGEMLVVFIIIIGVVGILVAIHCGSEYFQVMRHNSDDLSRLRDDTEGASRGISRHSLFYKFFFRDSAATSRRQNR